MSEISDLLLHVAELAANHLDQIDERPVFPQLSPGELRSRFQAELATSPVDPLTVIDELAEAASPGLVASPGGRYFGFVTGGALPASVGADWLATAWDQNSFSYVSSPAASVVEDIAARWVKEILRLPARSSVAFVTGCQMAHVTCLAAARLDILRRQGWNISEQGLRGGPQLRVIAGEKRHVTVDRALRLLGIGTASMELVAVDDQGRAEAGAVASALDGFDGPAIVVAQAGEVNTGSFDPLEAIVEIARERGAWVHVDGAFGIWARANRDLDHLVEGLERAQSWAFDAHKWLNVPYDSGIAVVADPDAHRAAMLGDAAYLTPTATERDAYDWTPEASRRGRGFAVYSALRSLGTNGLEDLIGRCCQHARNLAAGLAAIPGAQILNEVNLNQVLVRFDSDESTSRILQAVQSSGEVWMGGTEWGGHQAIRISVSGWATEDEDITRTIGAFQKALAG